MSFPSKMSAKIVLCKDAKMPVATNLQQVYGILSVNTIIPTEKSISPLDIYPQADAVSAFCILNPLGMSHAHDTNSASLSM